MDLAQYFVDFAGLGANWVLWLLIGMSVVSVGVMIDRALWFRNRDTNTETFTREIRGAFERDEFDRLVAKYKDDPAIPVQVALRGIADRARGADAVAEAMHQEKARWRRAADRNLIILGTLGNNVPFVGLFGTVLGVINAFQFLSEKTPDAEQRTLSTIAEALAATGVGLLVAIPAVVAFNLFSRKLKVVMGGADECAHAVLSFVYGKPEADKVVISTASIPAPKPGYADPSATDDKGDDDGGK
ncbi:MAG: MotA/TolQ/ExbB proton channel family protein [Deltaproteobacteria bacterium]|nr:MotA/TolQ/ExbB proton channel family protein [Deltaproteobacteria bacterium]